MTGTIEAPVAETDIAVQCWIRMRRRIKRNETVDYI